MSFTSRVVPIGEGWEGPSVIDDESHIVYSIHNNAASSVGKEGSSDDAKKLFPDTYVDMAKNATQDLEMEEEGLLGFFNFFRKRKKKR